MTLSPKQTKCFELLEYDPVVTEVFFGGSAGPGKSFFGCFWQIWRRLTYPGTRGLIGRSVLKTLKETTLETFFEVWEIWGKHNPYGVTIHYKEIKNQILFSNGSKIYLKDLFQYPRDKDFKSLGSFEITDAFYDEMPELTKKAVSICNSRIRYKLINDKPASLGAGNPAPGWVKHEFVITPEGNKAVLKPYQRYVPALLSDNPDPKFRKIYKENLEKLPIYDRQRLLYGDWTIIDNESPFVPEFDYDRHTSASAYKIDTLHTLYLSFDFNYDPCTAVVAQYFPGIGIDIYATHQVKGGTEALCEELKQYRLMMQAGIIVTGDNSGTKNDSRAGTFNDYKIVQKELEIPSTWLKGVSTANRNHDYSRDLVNLIFKHIPVRIFRKENGVLISDVQIAQVKSNASGKVELYKDRTKGMEMDAFDALRYLFDALFPGGFEDVMKAKHLLPITPPEPETKKKTRKLIIKK